MKRDDSLLWPIGVGVSDGHDPLLGIVPIALVADAFSVDAVQ